MLNLYQSALTFCFASVRVCLVPDSYFTQVVRHVLARHDPYRCGEVEGHQQQLEARVKFRGNELLGMVTVSLSLEDREVRTVTL